MHGALAAKRPQLAGYLAALRSVEIIVPRLDEAAFGVLQATAELHLRETSGCIYGFALHSAAGMPLLSGRATILLPPGAS